MIKPDANGYRFVAEDVSTPVLADSMVIPRGEYNGFVQVRPQKDTANVRVYAMIYRDLRQNINDLVAFLVQLSDSLWGDRDVYVELVEHPVVGGYRRERDVMMSFLLEPPKTSA